MRGRRKREALDDPGPSRKNFYMPLQAILDDEEPDMESEVEEKSKESFPPIKVLGQTTQFINNLLCSKGYTSYRVRKISIGVKIFCESSTVYAGVQTILKENKCQFFTHDKKSDRMFKAVLFGLDSKTSAELKSELISRGLKCCDVRNVTKTQDGFVDTLYIVHFENSSLNLNDLKRNHNCIFRTIVRWEHQRKIKNKLVQCRNCQMFGHGEKWCSVQTKCAHCAGKHKTDGCKSMDKIKCANCNGKHKAVDLDCPSRAAYIDIKSKFTKNSLSKHYQQRKPQSYIANNCNWPTLIRAGQKTNNNANSFIQTLDNQNNDSVYKTKLQRTNGTYSAQLKNNNDLFTESEITQLTLEMINSLRVCETKEQQFQVITQITIKYLYSNIYS